MFVTLTDFSNPKNIKNFKLIWDFLLFSYSKNNINAKNIYECLTNICFIHLIVPTERFIVLARKCDVVFIFKKLWQRTRTFVRLNSFSFPRTLWPNGPDNHTVTWSCLTHTQPLICVHKFEAHTYGFESSAATKRMLEVRVDTVSYRRTRETGFFANDDIFFLPCQQNTGKRFCDF